MTCDCIDKVDQELAAKNVRLELTFTIGGDGGLLVYPRIPLQPAVGVRRSRKLPTAMVPTFCPFCGAPYQPLAAPADAPPAPRRPE